MQFDDIKNAPHEALYVCPSTASVPVLKAIGRSLDRSDLRFVAPYQLTGFLGLALPGLVVDDTCAFDRGQWQTIERLADQVSDPRRYH